MLQKSTTGLLRSFLYQLLEADSETAKEMAISTNVPAWTERSLRNTFLKSVQATKYKICIFIDGLD
jgi:hypothetical protein